MAVGLCAVRDGRDEARGTRLVGAAYVGGRSTVAGADLPLCSGDGDMELWVGVLEERPTPPATEGSAGMQKANALAVFRESRGVE